MRVNKRVIGIAAIVAAVAVGGAVIGGRNRPAPPMAEAATFRADESRVYGLGSVEARILSRVGFDISGTLTALSADHGDRVVRGQSLARLDSREQQARVAQAQAGVRQAEAALAQASARLDRARAVLVQKRSVNGRRQNLVRNGTVSVEAAEDANATVEVAIADTAVAVSDVEAAKGGLESARARLLLDQAVLDKYALTAPFDGLVVERSRELGTAVTAGIGLFTIIDPATVWVRAFIDEAQAGGLAAGQAVEISLRSLPGQTFPGRVVRIDIESDRVSEERRVQVAFDAIPADIHLGEQAEVLIDKGSR